MKIKTIDIQAKEWFDKVNGNSYFSAITTINYGMEDAVQIKLPFQYGYGDHYQDMAFDALEKAELIPDRIHNENVSKEALWGYCKRNEIILRTNIIKK
jgi:hypothetical protein